MTGRVLAEFYQDGELYALRGGLNLVVDAGKNQAALRLDDQGNKPSHLALGSDNTKPLITDTALGTELQRIVFSPVPSISNNQITYQGTFTAAMTQTAGELGIFDAASAGVMLARWVINPTAGMVSGNTLAVTWILTFG